jgi:hypothetical protein
MKIFVKILKIAGLVFLAIIILIGSFWGYAYYTTSKEEARIEKAELNYKAINMVKNSKAIVNYTYTDETIRDYLMTIKGYLKILGWKAKKVNDQTYLVSYTYEVDSGVKGYYFDVNMNANVVRRILLEDHELERIYGLIKTSPKDDHIDKVPKNNSFSVFTSKDSNVFHKPNCFMLNKQKDTVGYFSVEEAKKKGCMPCNYCTP